MMLLKWVCYVIVIGTAVVCVSSKANNNCPWMKIIADCVNKADCQEKGSSLEVYEDCPVGTELFTITDDAVRLDSSCETASGDRSIILINLLDAEDENGNNLPCDMEGAKKLYFTVLDVNEEAPFPDPSTNTTTTMEVHVEENLKGTQVIEEIYYKDGDLDETETLRCEQVSPNYVDKFKLEAFGLNSKGAKVFKLLLLDGISLDFETQMVYKLDYEIISTDKRGNEKKTKHTFLVNVDDKPDNEPAWNNVVPFYEQEECLAGTELFTVTAQDRDIMMDYDIKYFLSDADPSSGTAENYFDIDPDTGTVMTIKEIDREGLLIKGIYSFTLVINATEYKNDTIPGEMPNTVQQVSTILIMDINDNVPTFNGKEFKVELNELTEDYQERDIDVNIVVTDMDEGDNGSFVLTTTDPENLRITEQGQQSQTIKLTALWNNYSSNIFDYEKENSPLTIKIIAVEKANTTHESSAIVIINLKDENDETPYFVDDPYDIDLNETTDKDEVVLQVTAKDDDITPKYSSESIRYNLEPSCVSFEIDTENGTVTLATPLDYDSETEHTIKCEVYARDEYGEGRQGTSTITVTIMDRVDEKPVFPTGVEMSINECDKTDTIVGMFTVTDADKGADIVYDSSATCVTNAEAEVSGWFTVRPGIVSPPDFKAEVVLTETLDRETCGIVTLDITATDQNTEEGTDSDSGSVTVTIIDENDEPPSFEDVPENLVVKENENADEVIFVFTVTDPDESDTIELSLSDDSLVYLSQEKVDLELGQIAEVEVRVKNGAKIDREDQEYINFSITLTDAKSQTATENFSVTIRDTNDNAPRMTGSCNYSMEINENVDNGTYVFTVNAVDDDAESPYNTVTYMLLNDQYSDSKNRWTPFTVDSTSGDVTVLKIKGEKDLDREKYNTWELYLRAYDECPGGDFDCKALVSDTCFITLNVTDYNDNAPRDLTWTPKHDRLMVNDFFEKGDVAQYQIWAYDDDEIQNANLTYAVNGTIRCPEYRAYDLSEAVDEYTSTLSCSTVNCSDPTTYDLFEVYDLFEAVDEYTADTPSCTLRATENFRGMNYTGNYKLCLLADDRKGESTLFEVDLEVQDANDKKPDFVFRGCKEEDGIPIITMAENYYTPGQDGNADKVQVMCTTPLGYSFDINYIDDDKLPINKEVTVSIDYDNSTVENADNEYEQVRYFTLEPSHCRGGCKLYLSHTIDREKGKQYNLSLHIIDHGTPPLQNWRSIRVEVTDRNDNNPYFCETLTTCTQTIYMVENKPDVTESFWEAKDLDNKDSNVGDVDYDTVYYCFVGGDLDDFTTVDNTEPIIRLKNKTSGLDREEKDKYYLEILATNSESCQQARIDGQPSNNTLHLTILVGDVNDETPTFQNNVTFASFTPNDKFGANLTVIEAIDRDLNETLEYSILGDFVWYETEINHENPFTITSNGERKADLILNFDPLATSSGYCTFTIRVKDKVDHSHETQGKVYVITADFEISMGFTNTKSDVENKRSEIESIYSQAFDYLCIIDSIVNTQSNTGQDLANQTTVKMHFINDEENEPVTKEDILDISDNAEVMSELIDKLDLINIKLSSFGGSNIIGDVGITAEEQILTLKILLGVVAMVLGCLLLLLITIYHIRTRSLTRKVKVLSTNTFGSKASGLNQTGLDMVHLPGSNYFAKEHGNHNPVFNEHASEFKTQDTESVSSGDSVLVGVEDNPEFRNYSAKLNSLPQDYENPSLGRSIDEVSAPPSDLVGGVKSNPLLNLSSF